MPPDPRLLIAQDLWSDLCSALYARTEGVHESGAFLLGRSGPDGRRVEGVVFYDQLDLRAYASGVCILHAGAFGPLWDLCARTGRQVVADIHVHPEGAWQSRADQTNPMIARRGHLALIVPDFAAPPVRPADLGFYEYLGSHRWRSLGGRHIHRHLLIGF